VWRKNYYKLINHLIVYYTHFERVDHHDCAWCSIAYFFQRKTIPKFRPAILISFFMNSFTIYYMASITSGEMADCDWLRSTFSGPLFSRNGPAIHYVKTNANYSTKFAKPIPKGPRVYINSVYFQLTCSVYLQIKPIFNVPSYVEDWIICL
jgi:hypothetical protein